MKITIEGEPKEIAALEQALKGSKENNTINYSLVARSPKDLQKILQSNLRKALVRQ
jgi:hypothetical protein